ncbi:MAG: hypothetical protein QOG15_2405 [Solirubrobacteraceae bacterium]|nr:hypothetical protein [Solirubrobacteraceae bacterium]
MSERTPPEEGPLGFDADDDEPPSAPSPPEADEDRRDVRRWLVGAAGNSAWLLALAGLVVLVVVTINAASTSGTGAGGIKPGARLPPFAVPLVQSSISCDRSDAHCDANVATRPGQGAAGARPACEVRGPTILNLCALIERGPVVLGFLATRGGNCADTFDKLGSVERRHPGVHVAVIGIRGSLGDLRAIVREHGWQFPVGWDRDGILANLYGVAVCPHIVYARWPGRVDSTSLGDVSPRELERRVDAAVAASRRAGWKPSAGG